MRTGGWSCEGERIPTTFRSIIERERKDISWYFCDMFMWGITRYLCFAYDAWLIKFHRGRDFVIYFDSEWNYTSTQNWFAPSRQSLQICVNAWVARWWAEHHFMQFAFLITWTLYICQINYIYVYIYDWYLSLTQPVERFQENYLLKYLIFSCRLRQDSSDFDCLVWIL